MYDDLLIIQKHVFNFLENQCHGNVHGNNLLTEVRLSFNIDITLSKLLIILWYKINRNIVIIDEWFEPINFNTFIGHQAGINLTGNYSVAFGNYSVAFGRQDGFVGINNVLA
jgi:hypothetical protein